MAGIGRKDFQAGAVLSAADVDGYLMDQSVMVFANSTARSSAIATATEGMQTYLSDSNTVYSYDGSAWNAQIDTANYSTLLPTGNKNALINGAFDFWQRSTSTTSAGWTAADRWWNNTNASTTWSKETSVVPSGFLNAMKMTPATTAQMYFTQPIETANTMPLVGKTVTLSAYLAASASTSVSLFLWYSTNTDNPPGGTWTTIGGTVYTATATYGRASVTVTVPSNAKSLLAMVLTTGSTTNTIYATGLQLEAGSVATPFNRAGGTIAGELAACQRYYYRHGGVVANTTFGFGVAASTTVPKFVINHPVTMRVAPTSLDYANLYAFDSNTGLAVLSSLAINSGQTDSHIAWVEGGTSGLTQYRPYALIATGTNGYVGFSAEL